MDINISQALLGILANSIRGIFSDIHLVFLLVIVFIIMPVVGSLIKFNRYKKSGMAEIDQMSGEEFELYLQELFKRLGYQVQHIGKLGDYGGDLIIKKDGIKTLIQAKRQKSKVKESAVQQAIAAKEFYKCDKAMVVSNNYYWKHAWILGKRTNTTLWTRKDLQRNIESAQ